VGEKKMRLRTGCVIIIIIIIIIITIIPCVQGWLPGSSHARGFTPPPVVPRFFPFFYCYANLFDERQEEHY